VIKKFSPAFFKVNTFSPLLAEKMENEKSKVEQLSKEKFQPS